MSAAVVTNVPLLVYFSSVSGNTARFIEKLGMPARRIPLHSSEPVLHVEEPYVLVTPTYGGGQGRGGGQEGGRRKEEGADPVVHGRAPSFSGV